MLYFNITRYWFSSYPVKYLLNPTTFLFFGLHIPRSVNLPSYKLVSVFLIIPIALLWNVPIYLNGFLYMDTVFKVESNQHRTKWNYYFFSFVIEVTRKSVCLFLVISLCWLIFSLQSVTILRIYFRSTIIMAFDICFVVVVSC